MSALICNDILKLFERELLRRLQSKTSNCDSESMLLLSAFRYYDNLNTGYINKTQWINSFNKIGLTGFSNKDLSYLFDYYDMYQTGLINYKQYTLFLLNPNSNHMPNVVSSYPNMNTNGNNGNSNGNTPICLHTQTTQYFDKILNALRAKINTPNGLGLTYYLLLEKMHKASYRMIHYDTVAACFKAMNIVTGMRDLKDFFSLLDVNDSQWVSIEQMMKMIRGQMPPNRRDWVNDCYCRMDKGKKGAIEINDICDWLSYKEGCVLSSGEMVNKDFIEKFRLMIKIYVQWKSIQYFTIGDFIEFFEAISAAIDNDEYFNEIISVIWTPIKESNREYGQFGFRQPNGRYGVNQIRRTPVCAIGIGGKNNMRNGIAYHRPLYSNKNDNYTPSKEYNKLAVSQRKTPLIKEANLCFPSKSFNQNAYCNSSNKNNKIDNTVSYPKIDNNAYQLHNDQMQYSNRFNPGNSSNSNVILPLQPQINNNLNSNTSVPIIFNHSQSTPNIKAKQSSHKITNTPSSNYQTMIINPNTNFKPNPKPNKNQQLTTQLNSLVIQTINKLRTQLYPLGETAICGLQSLFKQHDQSSTRKLALSTFLSILTQYNLPLTNEETEALQFKYTDNTISYSNSSEPLILYDLFLSDIIGELNTVRQNIIIQVFLQLDKANTDSISINDLKELYNPCRHPDVIEGRTTSNEVLNDWHNNINSFCKYHNLPSDNRSMSLQELFALYSQISLCIKEDRSFEYMIRNVWDIIRQQGGKRKRIFWV